ncbi:MAG TPA: hypothetical protein VG796_19905 [Verrucomicrobiales bacterium]|nr:hypothetical protein [Verrucomicrobiales bacterium]
MKAAADWREKIEVTEHSGKGTAHCFTARCPVCGQIETSTHWGDGSQARKGAVGAVLFHMRREHPEEFAEELSAGG